MNYSKQREVILETLKGTYTHPTVEELYNMVNKKYPTISKSTVYRNINILLKSNAIRKIKMQSRADRFEYVFEQHYHAICEKCGNVFDFKYDFQREEIKKTIQSQTGVIAKTDSITIYGICEKCKSK